MTINPYQTTRGAYRQTLPIFTDCSVLHVDTAYVYTLTERGDIGGQYIDT